MMLETAAYLGPARVLNVEGKRVLLALPDGESWAELAIPFSYEPAKGDLVLAAGPYVVGILQGTGKMTLTAPGDLEFRAPKGEIRFVAPRVGIRTGRLEVVARSVFERFGSAYRWVKDLFRTTAGRVKQDVDGPYDLKAGRIAERADGDVRIDGRKINLG